MDKINEEDSKIQSVHTNPVIKPDSPIINDSVLNGNKNSNHENVKVENNISSSTKQPLKFE